MKTPPAIQAFIDDPSLFIGMTFKEAGVIFDAIEKYTAVKPEPTARRVDFSRIPENNFAETRILARQERIGGPVFDI